MNESFFKRNREAFLQGMEENTVAVFFSDPAFADTMQPAYEPYIDRNFYYLTGLSTPYLCLVLVKNTGESILYEHETGFFSASLSAVRPSSRLVPDVWALQDKGLSGAYFFTYQDSVFDEENKYGAMARRLREKDKSCRLLNAYTLLTRLRSVKTPEEQAAISEAVQLTAQGLLQAAKCIRPGCWEQEILASFDYAVARTGEGVSFHMAAAGKNALQLHYPRGRSQAKAGELMLLDTGALRGFYTGDLSRTFPVSGRFSPRQRALYNTVLEAHDLSESLLKPGVSLGEIQREVKAFYGESLRALRVIDSPAELDKVYPHNIGHALGLYVHDPWDKDSPLVEGGVYTVEPGLYIPREETGIRIEDDYLITARGAVNLSKALGRTAAEAEDMLG